MIGPIINIITRTSNRPKAFDRCVTSVKNQTYKNINHVIITDDVGSINYIENNGFSDYVLVDRDLVIKNDKSPNPNTGKYSPHNLYFNYIKDRIKDGWVIYLDDDDLFLNNESLKIIVDELNTIDNDTILYWRMVYSNGSYLPNIINDLNPPRIGRIGGSCFTVNTKYIDDINWDGWKCGDFRLINNLHNKIPKYKWLPTNIIFVPIAGMGNKIDI